MRLIPFILLALFLVPVYGQEIRNLVFEGSGMRGLAYAGVIEEMEKKGIISSLERVGGTSAGAVTALLISLGYSAADIRIILAETKFQKFNDGGPGAFRRLRRNFGWYKGEEFKQWISEYIEMRTGDPDITLMELNNQGFLPLYATATCLNKQRMVVLSHETYPEMKVSDAMRITMSIPIYFEAVFVDAKGKVYDHPDEAPDLDIMVDGGIFGNYPIFLFDTIVDVGAEELLRVPNPYTLGIRIDSDLQISQDSLQHEMAPVEIDGFKDYVAALYTFVMENLNRIQLTPEDWERTISVSSAGMSPIIRKFSETEKHILVESGKNCTARYFQKR